VRDDHSEVVTSTDDYLWLKLGLVTFDETEAGSRDGLTLTQLQIMLLEDFGLLFFLFLLYKIPHMGSGAVIRLYFLLLIPALYKLFVCLLNNFLPCLFTSLLNYFF